MIPTPATSSPLQSFFSTILLPTMDTGMIQEDNHHTHGSIQPQSSCRPTKRPLASARWQTSEDSVSKETSASGRNPAAVLPPSPPQRRRKQINKIRKSKNSRSSKNERPSRWEDSSKAPSSPTLPPKLPTRIDECPSTIARRASGAA